MPIFEYNCRQCNQRFETVLLSAREKIVCPNCHSSALEKQLSVFSSPASVQQASDSASACTCTPQTCGCH